MINTRKSFKLTPTDKDKRIEELEKEIEKLKGSLELYESGGCKATNLFKCGVVKELKEQLTKAIGIIKRWDETNRSAYIEPSQELLEVTEQFLKGKNIILEDIQVGNSPFDADEVFNKEMRAYPEEK